MDNDHSGVFVRAKCDKCGEWANVELPLNVAAAWKADADRRRTPPCAHKHVLTKKEGAECRDCHAPLRFERTSGLYVAAT